MTLTEFITARLDEDEAVARGAARDGEGAIDWAGESGPTDVHIARHDPARVLAEVEAKRRIVEHWTLLAEQAAEAPDHLRRMLSSQVTGLGVAVRLLALPYADHPDYDERWRP